MNTAAAVLVVLASAAFCSACQASAKASLKTDTPAEEPSTFSEAPPAAPTSTAKAVTAEPAVATPPPTDACPLTCFEANGSSRVDVTAEEQAQLRTALEPVLSNMRGCASGNEWRRRGSAVINLRIAPDGTLADLGIDPHHGGENTCLDHAANGTSVSVALPGRKVVRCAERCQVDTGARKARRRR